MDRLPATASDIVDTIYKVSDGPHVYIMEHHEFYLAPELDELTEVDTIALSVYHRIKEQLPQLFVHYISYYSVSEKPNYKYQDRPHRIEASIIITTPARIQGIKTSDSLASKQWQYPLTATVGHHIAFAKEGAILLHDWNAPERWTNNTVAPNRNWYSYHDSDQITKLLADIHELAQH